MKLGRVVTLFLVAGLASGTSTPAVGAGRPQRWVGTTSQDKMIRFDLVKHDDGAVTLQEFDFEATLTCSVDGTTQEWGLGFGWGGRGPALDGRILTFDQNYGDSVMHLAGRIGVHRGSGTLVYRSPQFTQDEELQECSTGDLTWTVDRKTAEPFTFSGDVVVRVDVAADGEVARTVSTP